MTTTFTATATIEFDITDDGPATPSTQQVADSISALLDDHRHVFNWEIEEDGEGCWNLEVSAWMSEQQDWVQLEEVTKRHLGGDWWVGFGEAAEDED